MITMARVIAAARILGEPIAPTTGLWDALDDLDEPVVRPATEWWAALGQSGSVRGSGAPPKSGVRRKGQIDLGWDEGEGG